MDKRIEKIKYQLAELSVIVNAFQSEAVQVRVIDRLLQVMMDSADGSGHFHKEGGHQLIDDKSNRTTGPNRPGATRILSQLLPTDFFNMPRSIAAIVDRCNQEFETNIKASELSGVLLTLVKQGRLKRERSPDDNRFEYVKA